MKSKQFLGMAVGLMCAASVASAGITYTCDPGVASVTCNTLNTTIAGLYNSTFSNANADIYIQYGTTSLGQSTTGSFNQVTYSAYAAALTANTHKDALQTSALAALNLYAAGPYGSDDVNLTSALAQALGLGGSVIGGLTGTTAGGASCSTPGSGGCYNGIITITNDSSILYYDNVGGPEPSGAYDYYATVEHETDEVLGTASCMDTTTGVVLTDPCDGAAANGKAGNPSAVDLYRYNGAGSLALNASYIASPGAPAGAYFSYDGGTTNGAIGTGGSPKYYNPLANGDDYADYIASSPDCGTNQAVQDGTGCPGEDAGLSIRNDGGSEINILNAVGYDLVAPEPGAMTLIGAGLAVMAVLRRRLFSNDRA
jgi:hypothetical protein